ncbi:MAG TPA: hypothetical protein DCO77_11935, partial [Nitrospiraceae bacterium]|nr:hypothetical protein [Nitrospiraceae bacterium]
MKRMSVISVSELMVMLLLSTAMVLGGCGGGGDNGGQSNLNSLFSGDYQVHGMEYEWGELRAFSWDVTAYGNGTANVPSFGDITYTVALDRSITIDSGAGYEPGYGIISGDGALAAFSDTVYDIPSSTDKDVILHIVVKKSTGKDDGDLIGDYILSLVGVKDDGFGNYTSQGFYTARLLITAQGDGTGTWEILSHSVAGNVGMTGPFTYTVSPDGTFTINNGVADDFGIISPDGSMFALKDGDITDGDGETILAVGVKKSTGTIAPDMSGEMLMNQIALWDPLNMPAVYTSRVGLTFGIDTFSYEVLEHSLGYTGSGADIPYTVASDGTVSFPGGGSVEGIVSSDGNLFVGV